MMAVLISSHGGSWTFYASAGDKLFLIETTSPDGDHRDASMAHMVREARWLFGDRRMIVLNEHGQWFEVLHDGAGNIKGTERYDGPVPQRQDNDDE
jgi:creatinine amidohydrolase/Fe(II)-dependent formamide hydrolase-like protein